MKNQSNDALPWYQQEQTGPAGTRFYHRAVVSRAVHVRVSRRSQPRLVHIGDVRLLMIEQWKHCKPPHRDEYHEMMQLLAAVDDTRIAANAVVFENPEDWRYLRDLRETTRSPWLLAQLYDAPAPHLWVADLSIGFAASRLERFLV